MEYLLPITYLNDFIFCPYSIYLHQVFDNSVEEVYSSSPQQKGKSAHQAIDSNSATKKGILKGIYVHSTKLGVYGKIDTLQLKDKKLIESKFFIKTIYKGYLFQLHAQYFALTEMGYQVKEIGFFSIKDRQAIKISLPGDKEFLELQTHIKNIKEYDFNSEIEINNNKCTHCIYCNLCDKTELQHVYS